MPTNSRGHRPIPCVLVAIQQLVDMKRMPGSMASAVWTYGMLQPSVGFRDPKFFREVGVRSGAVADGVWTLEGGTVRFIAGASCGCWFVVSCTAGLRRLRPSTTAIVMP